VDQLFTTTLLWALLVFVLVEGVLLYAMFRFRSRPDEVDPKQIRGNTTVEIIWTTVPALILAVIAVPTVKAIFKVNEIPGKDALTIEIIGHQWWWEFRYPEYNITTANEPHVPVGRTVSLRMKSADVIHSFWAPQFAGKRDVFPDRETRIWFKAEDAGEYPGQCAEFCGIEHARMAFRLVAQSPGEFEGWIGHMSTLTRAPSAAVDPLVAQGQTLFQQKGCVGCHSLVALNAPPGLIGPNLTDVGAHSWIAAGTLKNTDENLARWIRTPQTVKPGALMPNLGVSEAEAKALVAFLRTHR
jgi:cytochrome c oxidase subunit 2